ncbi:hypothetical protein RN001_015322 [Aquatica leii]|uniref:AB hydrolase-1 domain-containing protein n=1 Tax=Aquatica leii TaxID=1421715 RepID=A0AAN7P1M9_9COLE|nr:hypothetical protein RN001_015322 [Aquatica leii]
MSRKCCCISTVLILILIVIPFLAIFVGFPLLFMLSIDVQRFFLFEPVEEPQDRFNLDAVEYGARNMYVTVNSVENITLGIWHFLPKPLYNDSIENLSFNYSDLLANSDYPVLFHCHGNGGNRLYHLEIYMKLTRYFHVFAFDYRSYGDSTPGTLSEEGLVQDTVALYKWLRNNTKADIYVWGHSMGTAVAAHTVDRLKQDGLVPMGLVLESPYTTLREEALRYPLARLLTWMPWFNVTMLKPIWNNGFRFETEVHVLNVDCPIMILHSKDDDIIPYDLAVKLYDTAMANRNSTYQGPVRLHLFPAELGYKHWAIYKSPLLPQYIKDHMNDALEYKNKSVRST